MLQVKFKTIRIPFRFPFQTAYGKRTEQEIVQIGLFYEQKVGIGEAPIIPYYPETTENIIELLQEKARSIAAYKINEPSRFQHFCHHLFPHNPFLVCALDNAYWHLYSQIKNKSVQHLLQIEENQKVKTNYTLGLDSYDAMAKKMEAHAWEIYKVKMENEASVLILEKLAKNTDSHFRVDANAHWKLDEAKDFLNVLSNCRVELIEQPLAKNAWEEHAQLKNISNIPIIADESFQNINDIEKVKQSFDGINIKLAKCGGLSPAIEIIAKARKNELQLMLGCMNESETGTFMHAQIAHLFDYVDLDGPLLQNAPLKRIQYQNPYLSWH